MNKVLLFGALVLVSAGCKKKVPEAPPAPPAPVAAPAPAPAPPAPTTVAQAVERIVANFQRVHFELDSNELNAESKSALDANAGLLSQFGGLIVEIQGHADERGTVDYNVALGQRRADSVRTYLVGKGVREGQLRTVSYGEERPIAAGSGEVAWSQNRRAEFRVLVPTPDVQGTTP